MPIKIADFPDPFTRASRAGGERPPLIESDVFRQLVNELRRYCDGELTGRSFLIAGHRGAGKTTLVLNAFEALLRSNPEVGRGNPFAPPHVTKLRPLLVLLQGPTLLPSSKEDLPLAVDGTGDVGRRLSEMENVLVQITLGLHRAVAAEMVEAFRRHGFKAYSPRLQINRREMLELAAQLPLELDDYGGEARLREIWRRCGALRYGVLYAFALEGWMLHDDLKFDRRFHPPFRPDQGLRELIGLASVCEAYRRISGKISRKDELKYSASGKTEQSADLDLKGKDLGAPLLALLAGGAVGAGSLVADAPPSAAALAGLLTALLGMVAGKISVSRKRERASSLEDLFIPDLSVATLDRVLPVLLERLWDAGLAPVFVIDELDKVAGLSERIQDMIRRLKKLVAESAFFCFLADRSYFEEMQRRTVNVPYSIEHTYFTHQLFISFRHNDMRKYLEQLLQKPDDVPSTDPKYRQISEEQKDLPLLPYILVHSAQMHPIDLQRQIARIRDADGNVILAAGAVRSNLRYQLELLLQLAIELQLESESMQAELDRRPPFRRLAHDALYYISRKWEQNAKLSFADDEKEEFRRYLVGRMAVEAPARRIRHWDDENETPELPLVSDEDLDLLWDAAKALAQSLAAPSTILTAYEKRQQALGTPGEVVLSALRTAVELGNFIEPLAGQPNVYCWKFRPSGRRLPPAAAAAPAPVVPTAAAPAKPLAAIEPPWKAQMSLVRRFSNTVRVVTVGSIDPSRLSAGLGILPTSPAWPQVSAALSRLETMSPESPTYHEMEEDVAVLGAYVGLLETNIRAVALSLECGSRLTAWSKVKGVPRLRDTLEKMSNVLGLPELPPQRVLEELDRLRKELVQQEAAPEIPVADLPPADARIHKWIEWMTPLASWVTVQRRSQADLSEKDEQAGWEFWRSTLRSAAPSRSFTVVIQAISGTGAFEFLKLPLETMTLRDWSTVFQRAVMKKGPQWPAGAALRALGWRGGVRRFLAAWPMQSEPDGWQRLERGGASAHAHVLIAAQQDALSESWRPEAGAAALVLRAKEWSDLAKAWEKSRDSVMAALRPDFVAVDISAASRGRQTRKVLKQESGVPDWSREFADTFGRSSSAPILLIANAEPVVSIPPRFRVVVLPTSLIALLRSGPAA